MHVEPFSDLLLKKKTDELGVGPAEVRGCPVFVGRAGVDPSWSKARVTMLGNEEDR